MRVERGTRGVLERIDDGYRSRRPCGTPSCATKIAVSLFSRIVPRAAGVRHEHGAQLRGRLRASSPSARARAEAHEHRRGDAESADSSSRAARPW